MTKLDYSILINLNEKLFTLGALTPEQKDKIKMQLILDRNKIKK